MSTPPRFPKVEARLQQALDRAVRVLGDADRFSVYDVDDVVAATEDTMSWAEPGQWPWFGVYVRHDGLVESWSEHGRHTVTLAEDGTITVWTTTDPSDRTVVRGPVERIAAKYRHPAAARFLN